METNIDWQRLYAEGRVKRPGVSWTEEELHLIYTVGIPFDYVRDGVTSLEEFEDVKAQELGGEVPLKRLPVEDLRALAKKKGVKVTPAMNRDVLLAELEVADEPKKKAARSKTKATKKKEK